MRRSRSLPIMLCVATAAPYVAMAQPSVPRRLALPAQPLSLTLRDVSVHFGIDLLFAGDLVEKERAPALSGVFTADQALALLLAGTGLVARRTIDGGYFVATAASSGHEIEAMPVPDILVVGRRTQNADIRRLPNDVQPYQVLSRSDVRSSHAATVEELLGKRISQDAGGLSFAQSPVSGQGSPQSKLDLRGLGSDETLILLDGRRLPRLPGRGLEFGQPDVNALSPDAIERAEVITSTAGGIHGPGAIAGVVNLVLARDYRSADVTLTRGITARGDAPYGRLNARLGFTPDHGATDVMLAYSRSTSGGLRVGDRNYRARASALTFARGPEDYWYGDLPVSNSTNVASSSGEPLVLKPAYGGASLSSWLTTLPPGGSRSTSAIGAVLLGNAGTLDFRPSSTAGGALESLVTGRETRSILANVRHRLGDRFEIYGDFVRLIDRGRIVFQDAFPAMTLAADDARNPFLQAIDVSFPIGPWKSEATQRISVTRASLGALTNLPGGWKADIDYSLGSARQTMAVNGTTYDESGYAALSGYQLPVSRPIEPFGDASALQDLLAANTGPTRSALDQINRFTDVTARFAGPVTYLSGGPLVATLLLEQRRESVPASTGRGLILGQTFAELQRAHSESVRSAYLEVRAPLFSEETAFAPLRGLELQIAVRNDRTRVTLGPDAAATPAVAYDVLQTASRSATLFTVGLKLKPIRELLLRASVATGEMSPPLSGTANARVSTLALDDKRGGRRPGSEGPFDLIVYGGKITPERAQSISAGFVATPFGREGAAFTVDYTRIRRSREVDGRFVGSAFTFLYNEDRYPGRVTRLALTPEDAARGFTGGIVTRVDTSYLSVGRTAIDAVDARAEIPFRTVRAGTFMFQVAATWQPRHRRFVLPGDPAEDYVNQATGSLEWRGNAGLAWERGALTMALNARYHGGYHVTQGALALQGLNDHLVDQQGSSAIPPALTFDLASAYRIELTTGSRAHTLEFGFGIQDLFDRRPSTVVGAEGSYSYYSDPRRRRFDFRTSVGF